MIERELIIRLVEVDRENSDYLHIIGEMPYTQERPSVNNILRDKGRPEIYINGRPYWEYGDKVRIGLIDALDTELAVQLIHKIAPNIDKHKIESALWLCIACVYCRLTYDPVFVVKDASKIPTISVMIETHDCREA